MPKRRKAKAKSTFLRDPAESVLAHLGKMLDRASPSELLDLAITGGLAYLGTTVFGFNVPGLLYGPIAYRLARTEGGMPPISQISGTVALAGLGVAASAPSIAEEVTGVIKDITGVDQVVEDYMKANYGLGPENYEIYNSVTVFERCPDYGGPGKSIEVSYAGGLAKACVYAPTISDSGGAG